MNTSEEARRGNPAKGRREAGRNRKKPRSPAEIFRNLPPPVQVEMVRALGGRQFYVPKDVPWLDRPQDDQAILFFREHGRTCKKLSEMFGVTERSVPRIVRRAREGKSRGKPGDPTPDEWRQYFSRPYAEMIAAHLRWLRSRRERPRQAS